MQVKGLFAEGNYGNKFNNSDFDFTVPFASLLEKDARERLMEIQQNHPKSQFYLYR